MTMEFKLPDLGEGVSEGEIVKWLVNEGQQIKEDQPMVEVMTDKATVQIPSPTSGTVKQILAKEGQTVKVGTNLVVLENGGKDSSQTQQSTPQQADQHRNVTRQVEQATQSQTLGSGTPAQTPATQETQETVRILATPATRKLARDLGVDIESVKGTGPGGRITEEDVRKSASRKSRSSQQQQEQVVQREAVEKTSGRPTAEAAPQGAGEGEELVPIHGIRKRISDKMLKSAQTTAAVTHVEEVDFSELISLREATKPLAESRKIKLTYLPFIFKAVILSLKQFPHFNATIDEQSQQFIIKHYFNLGFATDTPNGLIVPVVKNADKKNIFQIAEEIQKLSEDARTGKIALQDLQGGTFTITNIGTLGGVISTPIINIPEVAILGVHRIQKKPVVVNNEVTIRDMAFVALTFDHRIVDGADAARFTSKLKQYLENPSLIFVEASLEDSSS